MVIFRGWQANLGKPGEASTGGRGSLRVLTGERVLRRKMRKYKVFHYDNKPSTLEALLGDGWQLQAVFIHQQKAVLVLVK
jgi:hypothetical protein